MEADVTSYVSGVVRIEIVVQKRCFYRRILIYITKVCTTFDRPQLNASEGCCVFIGHEYIIIIKLKYNLPWPGRLFNSALSFFNDDVTHVKFFSEYPFNKSHRFGRGLITKTRPCNIFLLKT